ncbi:YlqD family protein [Radiobacillus deserti]|uniref:YlqD protein n=1 Tax=Radiobacillus deserti TaxID=2594883 RepID=A0A516KFI2_9BACI|nr:YlqD family protein [Radiobacillus deserti]QDP40153.1 hypothetical protein FN924_08220 [Radiobacillus deserti]
MQIIRKIPVKQVLTESSKETLHNQFISHQKQLEQECQQLKFEQRKLLSKKGISREEVTKRFQQEITKRTDKLKWIEFQLDQLETLPLGSELTEGEVESLVEVEVGSNWEELFGEQAIIVKDGTVIQIR